MGGIKYLRLRSRNKRLSKKKIPKSVCYSLFVLGSFMFFFFFFFF